MAGGVTASIKSKKKELFTFSKQQVTIQKENTMHKMNTLQHIQYNTKQWNTIQYNTMQYYKIQYNTIRYNIMQYNIINILHNDSNTKISD